jgi:hypothetical protein
VEAQHAAAARLLRALIAIADSAHQSYLDAVARYSFGDCFSRGLVQDIETLVSVGRAPETKRLLNLVEEHCRMLKTGLRCLHTDYRVFPGIAGALENVLTLVRSARRELGRRDNFLDWGSVAAGIVADVRRLHDCVDGFGERVRLGERGKNRSEAGGPGRTI